MLFTANVRQSQQKTIKTTEELSQAILSSVLAPEDDMPEDEKQKMMARIMAKLQSGRKLTQEELQYLQKTNPYLYQQAMRVQREAEAVEEKLKSANSKEEAANIVNAAITGISEKDPAKPYLVAAITRVAEEFRKSAAYARLPNTMEEADRRKSHKNDSGKANDGDEEFDPVSWSPLQEVFDAMPVLIVNGLSNCTFPDRQCPI